MPDSAPRETPPRVAALLLAAGLSRRMGAMNKLLADVGGEAMVRRMARICLACGLDLHVVTGHEREKVEAALAGLNLTFIHNPAYREGQQASARAGLEAIGAGYGAVLVALGDQPMLEREDIEALLAAWAASGRDRFLVPRFEGKRGNPVVIPTSLVPELLAAPPSQGPLTDCLPGRTAFFEASSGRYLRDIDTEEALAHFRRREP